MKMHRAMLNEISQDTNEQLIHLSPGDLLPLPGSSSEASAKPPITPLTPEQETAYECSLDGVSALSIPKPQNKEEEDRLVGRFLSGLRKLLSRDDNWTFWQQLELSLASCVRCQTCSEACPIYISSGRQEIYRPTFRSEVIRRIKQTYLDKGGRLLAHLNGGYINLNWAVVARLAELAYRCTMCRRCALACPMGVDNALVARELRKLFSQEMDIAPTELHELGTVQQLKNGEEARGFHSSIDFVERDIERITGRPIKLPVDKVGADFLFIQTSLDSPDWLKCPECFALIFDRAGVDWTLSSELGFGGTNFGVWYDDIQFARIALQQLEIARKLNAKKIVLGECGHALKGMTSIADRILVGDLNIPRESWLPIVEDIVLSGKLKLDPSRNGFAVTLHDPCNIVRQMGIIEPQRRILRKICPQFREMEPHGVDNYCCGGGGGFIVMSPANFPSWRASVAGRMKLKQILETFQDLPSPDIHKYVCAPCFTCRLQIRDLLDRYSVWRDHGIMYGGLVDLIVNSMTEIKEPFIKWQWH